MPRATPMQFSFNAGEWAPELYGRIDMEKYHSACALMENFIPTVQGPATRRPGARYLCQTNQNNISGAGGVGGNKSQLHAYTYNLGDAFVFEFPFGTSQFYSHKQGASNPFVAAAVHWPTTDKMISFAVSGDFVFYAMEGMKAWPFYFSRNLAVGDNAFYVPSQYKTINGPFADMNTTPTTVYASARSGAAITITASSSIFVAADIGRKFRIESRLASSVPMWEPAKAVLLNDLRRSDGKTYKALNAGTTGTIKPIHYEGAEYDGDAGVQWEYQDAGYGYAMITGFTSATQVTASTVETAENGGGLSFPDACVGVGNATTRWSFDAWGAAIQVTPADVHFNRPDHVFFFRNRLGFARSADRKIWLSVAGDFRNFAALNESGEVTADMAISITLESTQGNSINWVVPGETLLVGTPEAEFVVKEITTTDALGPANIKATRVSNYGSSRVTPLHIGNSVIFVSRSGRRLREISYDALSDAYKTRDLSILAPHMVASRITQLAWMNDPDNLIWACQEDGDLLALSYNQTENVMGWSRHKIAGGQVTSIACIPHPQTPSGYADQLWMCVRREVLGGGAYNHTIEIMDPLDIRAEVGARPFFDSYVSAGPGFGTITGLGHLVGREVGIFLDGEMVPPRVVAADGTVPADMQYKMAHVGLVAPATLTAMDIEAGSADGVAQSKIKRIARIAWRLLNTLGGKVGASLDRLEAIQYREYTHPQNESPPSFTGDKEMAWPGGYDRSHRPTFYTDEPFPVTIVGIIPRITTERD